MPEENEHNGRSLESQRATACFELGSRSYPRISWSSERLVAAWLRFGGTEDSSDAALLDEFLRLACLDRASGAVEQLDTEYLQPLVLSVERRCGDRELADEAVQRLRQKLLLDDPPRLAAYKSTGHLRAWLQVVAVRSAQDLARQRGARWSRESLLEPHLASAGVDLDTRLIRGELEELFHVALRAAVQSLPAPERHALRMHLLAGWNVSQIGEALGIHRATAARWVATAKQRLNESVRSTLAERFELSSTELDRLFLLLSTQFEAHLSQVFQTQPYLGASPDAEAGSSAS